MNNQVTHRMFGLLAVLGMALLATGCLKDGILPPSTQADGTVALQVDMVHGVHPFEAGMFCEDGAGNRIRFSVLKFYLTGIDLLDTDSNQVAGVSSTELLLDGNAPSSRHILGRIPNGHIEEFRFTAGLDRTFTCEASYPNGHPYTDPDMQSLDDLGRLHLFMKGYVDVNGSGSFDEGVDSEFEYRVGGGTVRPIRHFHVHADMVDGEDLTLGIRVDIRVLLLAIDLRAYPSSLGNDNVSDLLLDNLSVAVSPQ